MSTIAISSRNLLVTALLCTAGLVGLSACGSGGDSAQSSDSSGLAPASGNAGGADDAPDGESAQDSGAAPPDASRSDSNASAFDSGLSSSSGDFVNAGSPQAAQQALLESEALIRVGSVALRSDDIGHVVTRVYGIVGGVGGDISKEDTTTDEKGNAILSTLVVRVPVDQFDATLSDLSGLGTLINRVSNTKDVTTAVADIDSRVQSAQRSINTLRRLFSRATALGDIIRLESELSQRQANLESLEAQQRSLRDRTAMSTITMTVEPPLVKPKPVLRKKDDGDDKAGGFVSGIHQGWDALKATTVAVGHTIGVVLPIGLVGVVLAALVLWFVRRFGQHPTRQEETAEV